MTIVKHTKPRSTNLTFVNLKLNNRGYIQLEPVCNNNRKKGIYIHYGETKPGFRGQHIGFRLRKTAVNAARHSKIPLYQVSQNIERLVTKGNIPISGRIMQKLGATQMNYAPPCRAANKRNKYNFAFVVGGPTQFKRPIARSVGAPKRKMKKRKI